MSERPEPPAVPTPAPELGEQTFLTVAEVADLMRLSKMSVYRLIHAGDLEAVRFGRSFRVRTQAVRRYLDSSYFQAG